MRQKKNIIIGAGITGLAAGYASGLTIYEATGRSGGICNSYYIRPNEKQRLLQSPSDNEVYRFEIGGGHWIFGVDNMMLEFLKKFSKIRDYNRRSSVYDKKAGRFVPFPIQNHLYYFDSEFKTAVLSEIYDPNGSFRTMKEWLLKSFGKTLCDAFFFPFNELYTAGLYDRIAPQDLYKSPIHIESVVSGAFSKVLPTGYNNTFYYPKEGLSQFVEKFTQKNDIKYKKELRYIDVHRKHIQFSDESEMEYGSIISTIPLNKMVALSGIEVGEEEYPHTSVLVLNIGAKKGSLCPDDHWLYIPFSESGFHRIGFYSNVDRSFLPSSARSEDSRVAIYVEKSFVGGEKPDEFEKEKYINAVVTELRTWGFVEEIEVVDSTWIEVAYTWSLPQSNWKGEALKKLEQYDIYQIGRYGNWEFQGITQSIKDGLYAGTVLREINEKER